MKELPPFSRDARNFKIGYYKHYKGNIYLALYVGRHSESLEEHVIYRACYGEEGIWVRPLKMFLEIISLSNGATRPRFQFLGKEKENI